MHGFAGPCLPGLRDSPLVFIAEDPPQRRLSCHKIEIDLPIELEEICLLPSLLPLFNPGRIGPVILNYLDFPAFRIRQQDLKTLAHAIRKKSKNLDSFLLRLISPQQTDFLDGYFSRQIIDSLKFFLFVAQPDLRGIQFKTEQVNLLFANRFGAGIPERGRQNPSAVMKVEGVHSTANGRKGQNNHEPKEKQHQKEFEQGKAREFRIWAFQGWIGSLDGMSRSRQWGGVRL